MNNVIFEYTLLRANSDKVRNETLNAGVVVFDGSNTCVKIDHSSRLSALHPDFGRMNLIMWADQIQSELRKHSTEQQKFLLPLLSVPFIPDTTYGSAVDSNAEAHCETLYSRYVEKQLANLPRVRSALPRQSKLSRELKNWFRSSKIFSPKVEDLSKHLVVANYPVAPATDLYSDFALMNGQLHIMETLDLRYIDHLTPGIRGDAAIKGFTLNEAPEGSNKIAIISASDYGISRPAISMISKFADDVFDLSTQIEKQRFVDFMALSLHKPGLDLPLQ